MYSIAMTQMTLEDIKEAFSLIDDWEERYRLLIDLGRSLPDMPTGLKTPENKVEGCTSQVWLAHEIEDPASPGAVFRFQLDSDAHIVKGLLGLLLAIYEGKSAREILEINIQEIFEELNLETHLSPNRRSGFYAVSTRIKVLAQAQLAESGQK